jgi:hypothetical protein
LPDTSVTPRLPATMLTAAGTTVLGTTQLCSIRQAAGPSMSILSYEYIESWPLFSTS